MVRYDFECYTHGVFEREFPIRDGPPAIVRCGTCEEESMRLYKMPPVRYDSQGYFSTDYSSDTSTGDKLEQLNRNWSKKWGESPPPFAKDIKRNSSDIQ